MKTYSLDELKETRLMYDKNPPKFIAYLIFLMSVLIISLIVLASFTYKTEVVKTQGVLESTNKSPIQSQTTGKIISVFKDSGDYVKSGEVLFELDSSQTTVQIIALESKINSIKSFMNNVDELINAVKNIDVAILSNKNPFSDNLNYYNYQIVIDSINNITETMYSREECIAQRNSIKNKFLIEFFQSYNQYKYEVESLYSEISAYTKLLDSYKVYASCDGYISYNLNIKTGVVVDTSSVGSISEKSTSENSIFECYVGASNRNFIKEGLSTKIIIQGLSQSKYGTINGKIIEISNDIIIDKDNNVYYRVLIKPEDIVLNNKDNQIILLNGQIGEVRIKYEDLTWLKWAFKKIGITDR